MNVFVRDKAYADLEHIFEWINRDRPDAAVGVIERIFESLDRLAQFPFMGHQGIVRETFEWVVPGIPFIIVYGLIFKEGKPARKPANWRASSC